MKILVTGCAGFIGAHLVKILLSKNYQVIGIDNLNDYYNPKLKRWRLEKLIGRHLSFHFYKNDLCHLNFLKDLFQKYTFDFVIHLAAQAGVRYSLINPHVYEKSNLLGLLNLLEVVRKETLKPKFIFASSSSVYGGSRQIPFQETDPCDQPVSLYGATKRAGELMIQSYHHLFGLKACCLRFFTVYGPWGRPDMAYFDFTKRLFTNQTITLYQKDTKRDFTYIDDIIKALMKTMKINFDFEIINLGNAKPVRLDRFLHILEQETGKKSKFVIKKLPHADVKKTFANIRKAKKMLGWQPQTNIKTGLKNFIKWYKNYGLKLQAALLFLILSPFPTI